MEQGKNTSKPYDDRSPYFNEVDPRKWSLISFLKWKTQRCSGALDQDKEHGAFKCLLQNIANSKDINKATKAQELLNIWRSIKSSSEIKRFWKNQNLLKLQYDVECAKLQNEKKSIKIQSKDLDYVLDRHTELNAHANAIGMKRYGLIEQTSNVIDDRDTKKETPTLGKRKADDNYKKSETSSTKKVMTEYTISNSQSSTKSSDSSYVLSSSDSTISEEFVQKKQQYYIDYFVGPGKIDWNLENPKWVVSKVDVSELCYDYRAAVIKKCESMNILSATEELSLSHIFLFEEENLHELHESFDDELWEDIFNEFRKLYPNLLISEGVCEIFTNIIKTTCERPNYKDRQIAVKRYIQGLDQEDVMVEIIRNLIENELPSFTKKNNIEDTHIHYNVVPVLNPFFRKNKKTVIDWANTTSESSAMAKKSFDRILLGKKPDLIVRTTNPKKHVELLICEVKPHSTRNNLIAKDLVCLGKTMKNALDKSINDGVDDMVICGLQIVGFLVKAYILDLKYDGIYRMILIGECRLPEDIASWGNILRCYQVLSTIQDIINKGAVEYQSTIRKKKPANLEKIKMTKPMFDSPMKIPMNSIRG